MKIIEHTLADQREILVELFLGQFEKRDDDLAQHRIFVLGITGGGELFVVHVFADVFHERLQDIYRSSLRMKFLRSHFFIVHIQLVVGAV